MNITLLLIWVVATTINTLLITFNKKAQSFFDIKNLSKCDKFWLGFAILMPIVNIVMPLMFALYYVTDAPKDDLDKFW